MSLILMEQLETQEEGLSLTDMVELAHAHAAQPLADTNRAADDLWNIFTENDLEEEEELDALDATEAHLDVDEADRREPDARSRRSHQGRPCHSHGRYFARHRPGRRGPVLSDLVEHQFAGRGLKQGNLGSGSNIGDLLSWHSLS